MNPKFLRYSNDSLWLFKFVFSIYSRLNINISKGLLAVNLESNCLKVPAAKFLGLANNWSPCSSCNSFIFSKFSLDIYTSPLTTTSSVSLIFKGIVFTVLKFSVISSPTTPLPLVAPFSKTPFLYVNPTDNPSILNSTTYSTLSSANSLTLLSMNEVNSGF